jgi:hypothetical protein
LSVNSPLSPKTVRRNTATKKTRKPYRCFLYLPKENFIALELAKYL